MGAHAHIVSPFSLQLVARITKHGWFDMDKKDYVFRNILDEVGTFLRVSCVSAPGLGAEAICTCLFSAIITFN